MQKKRSRKTNQAGRLDGDGQYALLPYSMLRSEAWRSLSGSAAKVWLELRTRFNGDNNGQLHLSMDEGARILGLGKATIARAFKELQEKGFIELKRPGKWYGRLAHEWAITDKGANGHTATNAWRQWRKPKPQTVSVPDWNIKLECGSETEHDLV